MFIPDGIVPGLPSAAAPEEPQFYKDPDGVVRRGMGAYVASDAGSNTGLPLACANATSQGQSRPIILNRPFRSVAELGAVFSGTPWKNLDFFTPESGDAALLDVFCIRDGGNPDGLEAGKVNLNTRQATVLEAIISGAYKDEQGAFSSGKPAWRLSPINGGAGSEADGAAVALVNRTTSLQSGKGPLTNVGDLAGRYTGIQNAFLQPYDGFSSDLGGILGDGSASSLIQRFREAPIRALAACGQTRVWNLMIDLVVQTGRYPSAATGPADFVVEGEQRHWIHVAIDRFTGDQQVEVVDE